VQAEVNKTESEMNTLAQGGEPATPSSPDFDPAFGSTADAARVAPGEPGTESKRDPDSRPEKSTV
jgi:hypothetical protein